MDVAADAALILNNTKYYLFYNYCKLDGVFMILYSTVVTLIVLLFLWKGPAAPWQIDSDLARLLVLRRPCSVRTVYPMNSI